MVGIGQTADNRLADANAEIEALQTDVRGHNELNLTEADPTVPVCRDPFDMPLLHLAAAGLADALVTGGADLLTLARVGHCPTMTPEAFVSGLPPSASPHP